MNETTTMKAKGKEKPEFTDGTSKYICSTLMTPFVAVLILIMFRQSNNIHLLSHNSKNYVNVFECCLKTNKYVAIITKLFAELVLKGIPG